MGGAECQQETAYSQYRCSVGTHECMLSQAIYRPWNFGLRFSANALNPSCRSSVSSSVLYTLRSRSRPASKGKWAALSIACLAAVKARGAVPRTRQRRVTEQSLVVGSD